MSEAIKIDDIGETQVFTFGDVDITVDIHEAADRMAGFYPIKTGESEIPPEAVPIYVAKVQAWIIEKYGIECSYHKANEFTKHIARLWDGLQKKTSTSAESDDSTDSIVRIGPVGNGESGQPISPDSNVKNSSSEEISQTTSVP